MALARGIRVKRELLSLLKEGPKFEKVKDELRILKKKAKHQQRKQAEGHGQASQALAGSQA